jgi:hypothetical protein
MLYSERTLTADQKLNYPPGLWDRSRAAEASVLLRAGNAEFLHLGLECGALHS